MMPVDIESKRAIFWAVMASAAATLFFNTLPVFLGVAAETLQLNGEQLGQLAAAEIGGICLTSTSAVLWIRRVNWRWISIAGLLVMAAGNLLCMGADNFSQLVALRFLIGLLGDGVMLTVTYTLFGDVRDTDRAFAFSIAGQTGLGMLGLMLMPHIAEWGGLNAVLMAIASVPLLLLPICLWMPERGRNRETVTARNSSGRVSTWPVALGLVTLFLWFMGLNALWTFAERIGAETGLAQTKIGLVLSLGMGMGFLGALVSSWMGDRFGRLWQAPVSFVCHALIAALFLQHTYAVVYIGAALLFSFIWNIGLPYMMGLIARADVSGRFTAWLITFITAGQVAGSLLGGKLVGDGTTAPACFFAMGCCAAAMVTYWLIGFWAKTPPRRRLQVMN
ncbi:MFS transporter [Pseudomaricurvus alkylphenolicus]|uniref:MFS transporter n=1 Tax=Pseudomaricurvus alkylphenolicus TaxID=1306991 RepID=UPI001F0E95D7|nr:MFS transporter [Pseudomaricurvus alkylphenolicus]